MTGSAGSWPSPTCADRAAIGPQGLQELVYGDLADDHQDGRRPRLEQVLDLLPEAVLDGQVSSRADAGARQAQPGADDRAQREQDDQPDEEAPEPPAERSPGHGVMRQRGDMQLALPVAPDDRRVLQVYQVVPL
jgi:hypothetical protein